MRSVPYRSGCASRDICKERAVARSFPTTRRFAAPLLTWEGSGLRHAFMQKTH